MSSLQDVFFSRRDPVERTGHLIGTLYSRDTLRRMRESAVASRGGDTWRNSKTSQFPKSFAVWIQVYSDRTATSLMSNALVICPFHVVLLNASERRRR